MKNETVVQAIEAADKQLASAGLPTYSQLLNQAKQLSAHAQTVQMLTEGGAGSTKENGRVHFSRTDC